MITSIIVKRGTLYYKIWFINNKPSKAVLSSFYQFKNNIENIKRIKSWSISKIKEKLKEYDYIEVDKITDNTDFFVNRSIEENLLCYR